MTSTQADHGFDFFSEAPPTPSRVTADEAQRFAERYLGYPVMVSPLGSQQDQNFRLTDGSGEDVGVLRIANPVFSATESEAQDHAAELIEAAEPKLRTATLILGADGGGARPITDSSGRVGVAKVLKFLHGTSDASEEYLSPRSIARMGEMAGQVSRALAAMDHPGLNRTLQWDLRHAERTADKLLPYVDDDGRRQAVGRAVRRAWERVERVGNQLPIQAVHSDLSGRNMIRSPEAPNDLDGILDFGDLCRTWAVNELAVTVTSMLHHPNVEAHSVLPAIKAFHGVRPLSEVEVDAIWPLVVLRAATLVLSGCAQVTVDPDNVYAAETLIDEWDIFDAVDAVPTEVMTPLIRDALGLDYDKLQLPSITSLLVDDRSSLFTQDLGTISPAWDDGAWMRPGAVDEYVAGSMQAPARIVATSYAARTPEGVDALSQDEPATVRTGIDLWFREPTDLRAPWEGTTRTENGDLILVSSGIEIVLSGLPADRVTELPTGPLGAGAVLATACEGQRVTLTVRAASGVAVPAAVRPSHALGWLSLTADPAPLLGQTPAVRAATPESLLERRRNSVAEEQHHYYDDPPQIERGWRHHLLSTDGRSYLDMVNNVAVVGHSHPRLAAAVDRQMRTLNTNSRFNYGAIVELCERLTARLPEPLNRVFLVNSGSEAADLSLRISMAVTGRRDVVAMREAYHGWTYAADAISTSTADNPNALTTRPAWVHTVDSANSYRGTHRGDAAFRYAEDAVAQLEALAEDGYLPAAFIAEAVYGNAGGMALPDGYLRMVFAAVRRLGGLAIADEVQVGYGRLGSSFWGFEQQDVVPDIVTMAKAMGNGHPLGVVVTSEEIAGKFGIEGNFFSSAGGSPVSSIVGSTVLDIIDDEQLQANALRIGNRLKAGLERLMAKHRLIGTVHGSGFFIGVELVRDRSTMEAAPEETLAICRRMLDYGVIVQPTGDRMCILKVKPPLCLDAVAADFFVATLDRVLTEGW
jgi:4-aminobutyrate aminotransferase-like enzyme/Ser/Thr protein kinase RdoA (MazF antagonist)